MKWIFSLMFFQAFIFSALAQSITVIEASDVEILMDRYTSDNRMNQYIDGWRIQIVSSTDRRKIEEMKTSFTQKFPNIPIISQHTPPYYKIKVGAFPTKLEAMGLLYKIKQEVPGAYPTKDNKIRPAEMVGIF